MAINPITQGKDWLLSASSGTLAGYVGSVKYSDIDAFRNWLAVQDLFLDQSVEGVLYSWRRSRKLAAMEEAGRTGAVSDHRQLYAAQDGIPVSWQEACDAWIRGREQVVAV